MEPTLCPSLVSSSNMRSMSMAESKSLIQFRNNIGPRTLPWGTPERTSFQVEFLQFGTSPKSVARQPFCNPCQNFTCYPMGLELLQQPFSGHLVKSFFKIVKHHIIGLPLIYSPCNLLKEFKQVCTTGFVIHKIYQLVPLSTPVSCHCTVPEKLGNIAQNIARQAIFFLML